MGCLFILSIRLDRHAAPISSEGTGKLVVSLQPAGHSDHLLCPAQLPSVLAPVAANGFIGINAIHPAYGCRQSTIVQLWAFSVSFKGWFSRHPVSKNPFQQLFSTEAGEEQTALTRAIQDRLYESADVQKAQRRAAIGTSLRHSGHFFVVGSGGASPRLKRAIRVFTGTITKK